MWVCTKLRLAEFVTVDLKEKKVYYSVFCCCGGGGEETENWYYWCCNLCHKTIMNELLIGEVNGKDDLFLL